MANMENADLKWIKKHYGEKFSHLCRELFPTLLEKEGLLKKLISDTFLPSRELYDDIVNNALITNFKNYIYNLTNLETPSKIINKTPEELMDEAGYILYPECQTEEDIQSFRHYYHRNSPTPTYNGGTPEPRQGEEICTFNGGRLNSCRVWFAVKKNVDEIRREDFKEPRREDDYGVSVISIQFSRRSPSTLSIKNRYNHTITNVNPDATFGNNLDNIIEGLTQSFTSHYGIELLENNKYDLEIPNYVKAEDKKFYKYNLEIDNVYYCPNNTIIVNGEVKTFDKDKYVVFEHFVLDLKNKIIIDYQHYNNDSYPQNSFPASIGEIKDIKRIPNSEGLTLQITPQKGEIVEIKLNKNNQIVGLKNPNVTEIGNNFLTYNKTLSEISLPNVQIIGNDFLFFNESLIELSLPKVEQIGSSFLYYNELLTEISLPNVQQIGNLFLNHNESLTQLSLPNVQKIEHSFLSNNNSLTEITLPNAQEIGDSFLCYNSSLTELDLPNVQKIGICFLCDNDSLKELSLPKVTKIGRYFLFNNNSLINVTLPNVANIGRCFLGKNNSLTEMSLPNATNIGACFLDKNQVLTKLDMPKALTIEPTILDNCYSLEEVNLPPSYSLLKKILLENAQTYNEKD